MGKILAVHSYKGGTGKTLTSTNLAASFIKHGKKVCLLDLDFRAPSLHTIFDENGTEHWINDYLNGACDIQKVITDITKKIGKTGKLYVGLANPSTEAIRDMSAKDRKWEMRALGRLLSLKNSLLNDMDLDFVILDTSPGLQYSSINAIVSADITVVVSTLDKSDVQGTRRMVYELYDLFEKKSTILLNKVLASKSEREKLNEEYEKLHGLPILEVIPCYCDVQCAGGSLIFTRDKPNHPFTEILDGVATKIGKL